MKLWYEQPAKSWNEALPIGNGRLGAMVYGNTDIEKIPLNEDTLWSGHPVNLNPRNKREQFLQAIELAKSKKYHEAQELVEKELTSGWSQSYMPLGDLILSFNHNGMVSEFTRSLDLNTAVALVEYKVGGIQYKREMFASAPDNVIVFSISSDTPQSISLTLNFDCLLKSAVSVEDSCIVLEGEAPSHVEPIYIKDCVNPVIYSDIDEERGMLFAAMVRVMTSGGRVKHTGKGIAVENADSAVIFISAHTSFAGFDVQPYMNGMKYKEPCIKELDSVCRKTYDELLSRHIEDYKRYYDRVFLDLGESEASTLPTDQRLYRFNEEKNDPALYTLLFQYGRYLLISSSREGTQATNLQGIWNSELRPPWSSNYTLNINTQMNYWPVFPCALGELQQPLVELIKELSVTGKVTAQEVYGTRGFVSHHNTDLWRLSSPVGNHRKGCAGYAYWNMSAGWLCRHLFDQYEYTLDTRFLKDEAYPIMKSAAEFLLDIMTEDEAGYLILCPSTSPENVVLYEDGKSSISATSTMNMVIAKELFHHCIKSCEILGCDSIFAKELKNTLDRLYPYKTGSKGQLLEWYEECEEADPLHRHISHLYGLHPANEITIEDTPELAQACKTSLNIRGDEGTGWSLGWKINQWARLFDGDRALKLINRQLKVVEDMDSGHHTGGGTYINMLDACPPFQIDGNFGAASGITEMLLQSRDNKVFILPALPSVWEKGCARGLRAKRRIKVDIEWDGHAVKAELLSDIDQTVMVSIKGTELSLVTIKSGVPTVLGLVK